MAKVLPPKPSVVVPSFNDVTRHNLSSMQLVIRSIIDRAHHIALDTEFTGLGDRRQSKVQDIAQRYNVLADVVRRHAVVAFGLAIFERKPDSPDGSLEDTYIVHNFNFLMLKKGEFTVSPDSMTFLVDNGFDFNRLCRDGIWYQAGNESPYISPEDTNLIMRSVFAHILSRRVPVIVHNGLLDLLFIYYSFHAELPKKLDTFVVDLSEMFPGGVYDTKYIADYVTREKASYLAYLYRKYERLQSQRSLSGTTTFVRCEIRDRMPVPSKRWEPPAPLTGKRAFPETGKPFCEQYAAHGVCHSGRYCTKSHDLDVILDEELGTLSREESRKRRKHERRKGKSIEPSSSPSTSSHMDTQKTSPGTEETPDAGNPDVPVNISNHSPSESHPSPSPQAVNVTQEGVSRPTDGTLFEKYHSACFDAYMTGFIYTHQVMMHTTDEPNFRNKIYLMSKTIPLLIHKSAFGKTSAELVGKK
ncbi:ribonuclease CAF1 [Phlyctochytrium arcticum]|nr:ribonuclease CAF1 [Phlyctochytrium arcticum]